ncbi:MAG: hypothetical protein D6732_14075 [Methanobacteriota archaeon]|nr:MAG: hypothetical protein D6732_14075 [Euryarchaeota archaeon]
MQLEEMKGGNNSTGRPGIHDYLIPRVHPYLEGQGFLLFQKNIHPMIFEQIHFDITSSRFSN